MAFGDVARLLGIMGVVVFFVKQPPLLMKIYMTQKEMFLPHFSLVCKYKHQATK